MKLAWHTEAIATTTAREHDYGKRETVMNGHMTPLFYGTVQCHDYKPGRSRYKML